MKAHVNQWLQAWHDGELDESLVPVVEEHLRTCEACQEELRELDQLSAVLHADDAWLLDAINATQKEDEFVNLVMRRIHQDDVEPESFFDSFIWKSIPAGLLGVWASIQAGWWILRSLRLLRGTAVMQSEYAWLADNLAPFQALRTFIEGNTVASLEWASGVRLWLNNWLRVDILFETVLNPALITTVIISMMFASWFAMWWLRQEQRNKITQMLKNGG